ncbi:hypothetical protein A7D16_08235 [Xanthomonas nasturtii]|uniref:Uncharacterized protein n=1 Tax=Xanthomonas nasturtii TaxID=1843581 RepID=A0A3E1KPZ3_9XANT|nr:hypothetical protein [Xanthomonas nasturtii]MCL1499319.1 hypothetical protein [Xanthomonas nasturtii]MCL1503001.1 hypothetical protein [Xanthomonas nasturtii]MCL1522858.1 hypothetical protein [Xanthomonas nasturtii]MCL1531468.1 hypothetical protein [Xanthomonas nasturtii]MCL1559366.1 hypothetical protein [Xanthomonas nasturtii]
MIAIGVFDNAARNLMRRADANCASLTGVGKITDTTHCGTAKRERIALILLGFSRDRCAAVQHMRHSEHDRKSFKAADKTYLALA